MKDKYDLSIEDICRLIWDLEEKHDLFNQTEGGIHYWPLIRFNLYYDIVQKTKIFGNPHPHEKRTFKKIVVQLYGITKSVIFQNPFLTREQFSNIVMPHPRHLNGVDIYTAELFKNLDIQNTMTLVPRGATTITNPNAFDLSFYKTKNALLARLFSKIKKPSSQTQNILNDVHAEIKKHYEIEESITRDALKYIVKFERDTQTYKNLFEKNKIKNLFTVISYSNQAATHAAQLCGATVTELQHGTFTKYHLGYSFPVAGDSIPYFPNKVLCFGDFWPESTPLPTRTAHHAIGAPYIEDLVQKLKNKPKKENSILFSSQGVIAKYLLPFAIECAKQLPDYKIIYRLHPSENSDDYKKQTDALSPTANFSLSSKTPNIFELIAEQEIQAGVFSTTLLEGMALGCKTILIDMPGIEYMRPVVARGDAVLVKTPEEFMNAVKIAKTPKSAEYYYAKPIENFKDIL